MMATKRELVGTILAELQLAQDPVPSVPPDRDGFWLPPTLPTGEGQFLAATDRLIDAVGSFADIVMDNDRDIARSYTRKDLRALMRRAFGQALVTIELEDSPDVNCDKVLDSVSEYLMLRIDHERIDQEFLFGSWFLRGDQRHDIQIGPVRLEDRHSWLARARLTGNASVTTFVRLNRLWAGGKLRKRRSSWDRDREAAIRDSIGSCPAVCSIRTAGLVATAAEQKALLAVRLAHTAIALMWTTPSSVLNGMRLLYDGDIHHAHYVNFCANGTFGASHSMSNLPGGPPAPVDWDEIWNASDWIFNPIGEAIAAYVEPGRPLTQPVLMNALFLSLWWFHDACRERSPLMAVVKFAASMDVLADGKKRRGITQFIEARRGANHRGSAILTSGETPDALIANIYDYARSRTIHGSNDRIGHDWSQARSRAELLARLCLHMACSWITEHPDRDDVEGMQEL